MGRILLLQWETSAEQRPRPSSQQPLAPIRMLGDSGTSWEEDGEGDGTLGGGLKVLEDAEEEDEESWVA